MLESSASERRFIGGSEVRLIPGVPGAVSCRFFVLARPERYHPWICVVQRDVHAQRPEYLPVGLYVGIKRTRRLGPPIVANINSGFYCGPQFSRGSRPDASVSGEPPHQLVVKSIIGFRQHAANDVVCLGVAV